MWNERAVKVKRRKMQPHFARRQELLHNHNLTDQLATGA